MNKKINIGEKGKVLIKWQVLPIDYSREEEKNIISKFASKYGIPKENVYVEPNFISLNKNGEKIPVTNDIIQNIQDPKFQQQLFDDYLKERGITDYDLTEVIKIDNDINQYIDYESYGKNKKYEIKWIKWSNFMSYGPNNFFDFTKLSGLVLLNGIPQNQSGKSTFSTDLIKFLLFGKVSTRNTDWTLADVFNKYKPEDKEVIVEGCLNIDNEDYIIRRVLTRPDLKKRTEKSKVVQKVSYYKLVNSEELELTDIDNQEGESATQTNQIIKDAIGSDKDFDLVISANADNLKSLISLKDTERGRLLSRWVGLLPLEEKDKLARDKFNKEVNPKLIINKYNKEDLKLEIKDLTNANEVNNKSLKECEKNKEASLKKIKEYETTKETLLTSKREIDKTLLNVDVKTVETALKAIEEKGKAKREEKNINEQKLAKLKDISFSEADYKELVKKDKDDSIKLDRIRSDAKRVKNEIDALKKGEFCPTCGAKLKNVDNSKVISEKTELYNSLVNSGVELSNQLKELKANIEKLEKTREEYNEKTKLELIIATNIVDLENLGNKYKEQRRLMKDLNDNKAAIENNNKIDLSLNIINANIKNETQYKDTLISKIEGIKREIENNNKAIEQNNKLIETIEKEEKILEAWKLYIEMVGKNGISKMVLRNALPLINGELKRLLNEVCDFDVEVVIDNHNDVAFNMVRDGVVSPLGSGSGFEQTCAGLALRIVLGNISILPKPGILLLDEVLGGVSEENYDKMKLLYQRIVKDYHFVFQITHLQSIVDWHDTCITIKKENNISKIISE